MSSVIRPTVFIVSCFPIIIIRKQFWVLSFNIWLYCGNIRDIVISGFSSILQYPLHETILHGGQYISFLYCVLHCSTKSCVSSTDFSLRLVAVVQYLIHMAPSLVHYCYCTLYTFSSILYWMSGILYHQHAMVCDDYQRALQLYFHEESQRKGSFRSRVFSIKSHSIQHTVNSIKRWNGVPSRARVFWANLSAQGARERDRLKRL